MNLFRRVLNKISGWLKGLYQRVFHRAAGELAPALAPEVIRPGYTLKGSVLDLRGVLSGAPMVQPSREFLLHVPANHKASQPAPLVIWLHGCRQSAEEFRDGTRIVHWADQRGLMVLMPRQSQWANPFGCWNWFDPATQDGRGETALILAQLRELRSSWNLDTQRIWIAGMSSGAALAACVAVHGRKDIRAAAFVAGLASGAAASAATALNVMKQGPDNDVAAVAHRLSQEGASNWLPSLIIQGEADPVVAPLHARELTRQMLALNGEWPQLSPLRDPDQRLETLAGNRRVLRELYRVRSQTCVELLRIEGLGHAWSGGDERFEYNDAAAPDATESILDFFARSSDHR